MDVGARGLGLRNSETADLFGVLNKTVKFTQYGAENKKTSDKLDFCKKRCLGDQENDQTGTLW